MLALGLGISYVVLGATDPVRRRLASGTADDGGGDGRLLLTIQTLMGRDVAPRFEFIMERAPRVDEVDV